MQIYVGRKKYIWENYSLLSEKSDLLLEMFDLIILLLLKESDAEILNEDDLTLFEACLWLAANMGNDFLISSPKFLFIELIEVTE